jgi:hypothetical protein
MGKYLIVIGKTYKECPLVESQYEFSSMKNELSKARRPGGCKNSVNDKNWLWSGATPTGGRR